jgi:hemerythrin-like domain-containing protein
MASLLAAARRLAAGRPEPGDKGAVHDAVAYFGRAVTRHFLDEEGSVFPRLSTRRPELAAQLAALSAEHPTQIALQNAVAEAAKQLDGESRPTAGKQLLEIAERLAEQHRAHVSREDELFQSAHQALTPEDDREIVAEMETRRDRDGGGKGKGRGAGKGGGGGGGQGKPAAKARPKTKAKLTATRPAAKTAAKKQRPRR